METLIPRSRMTYKKAREQRSSFNEANDCTVIAVAIAGKVPYGMAHSLMKMEGRENRGTSTVHATRTALRELGAEDILLDIEKLKKKNKGVGLTAGNVTRVLSKYRTYIAFTTDHVLTIRKGIVEDHTAGGRHRLLEIFEIKR
jgi:hypothetical protein